MKRIAVVLLGLSALLIVLSLGFPETTEDFDYFSVETNTNDEFIDTDVDGVEDTQDPCPYDNPDDANGNGVCDSEDIPDDEPIPMDEIDDVGVYPGEFWEFDQCVHEALNVVGCLCATNYQCALNDMAPTIAVVAECRQFVFNPVDDAFLADRVEKKKLGYQDILAEARRIANDVTVKAPALANALFPGPKDDNQKDAFIHLFITAYGYAAIEDAINAMDISNFLKSLAKPAASVLAEAILTGREAKVCKNPPDNDMPMEDPEDGGDDGLTPANRMDLANNAIGKGLSAGLIGKEDLAYDATVAVLQAMKTNAGVVIIKRAEYPAQEAKIGYWLSHLGELKGKVRSVFP